MKRALKVKQKAFLSLKGFQMPKIVSDLRVQINIRNIAIITVKTVAYHCIMFNISKSDTADLLENSVLEDRRYI